MPVIYPFLLAIIPILHILASNPGQASFSDALIPMLISLSFTLVAFVILRLVLKNWEASGLIVSLFLVLFFSYGHLYVYIRYLLVKVSLGVRTLVLLEITFCIVLIAGAFLIFRFRSRLRNPLRAFSGTATKVMILAYIMGLFFIFLFGYLLAGITRGALYAHFLFFTFCAILIAGVCLIVKFKERLRNPTRVLNVVVAALMVLTLVNLFTSVGHKGAPIRKDEVRRAAESEDVALPDPAELPDIYYIILDSYGSESFLRDHYGYDNTKFIRWLEDRGFYVAHDSHSNYNSTYTSLASSLNLKYINYLSEEVGKRSQDMGPLHHMIEDNSLMRFLKSRGYKFVFFGTGYAATQANRYADIAHVGVWNRGEFIIALLNSTVVRYFAKAGELDCTTRESVLNTFANIPRTRKRVDGPLFLFAHIQPPHGPFLFNRDGGVMKPKGSVDDKYIEQLIFVNKKAEEMVEMILSVSDRPTVIVIQGDHGPNVKGVGYGVAILNAYHLPVGENLLYGSITPVNSFRVILNSIFGTDFSLLEDRIYISTSEGPYSFEEIIETLDGKQ